MGDLDGDGSTDVLYQALGGNSSFFNMGNFHLYLTSGDQPLVLNTWYSG